MNNNPLTITLALADGVMNDQINTSVPDSQAADSFRHMISDCHKNTKTAIITITFTGESATPVVLSIVSCRRGSEHEKIANALCRHGKTMPTFIFFP